MRELPANSDRTTLDPARLRYLTQHFEELKGLDSVACGVGLALMQMVQIIPQGSGWLRQCSFFLALVLLPWAIFIASLTYIPRYYARRIGWVQQRPALYPWSSKQVVSFVAFVFLLWIAADVFRSFVSTAAYIDPLTVTMSVAILVLSLLLPVRRLRAWMFAGVVGMVALLPYWFRLDGHQLLVWRLVNASSIGACMIVSGLWDHFLLLRMLPDPVTAAEDE